MKKATSCFFAICIICLSSFVQARTPTGKRPASVSFISRSASSDISIDSTRLPVKRFIKTNGGLSNFEFALHHHQSVSIAFLGGSITHMKGWRDEICQRLTQQYPNTHFQFLDAGIPSLGSVPHSFRVQKDVLNKGKTDLLFIEAAVNDRGNGTTIAEQTKALEGIVRHVRKADPMTDMVLMAFADEDKLSDYAQGRVPPEVAVHENVARHYQLPFINLAREVYEKINHQEFTWARGFKSLHPAPFGQHLYAEAIWTLLSGQAARPVPNAQVAKTLPMPIEKNNYQYGHYESITEAKALKGFRMVPDWQPNDSVHTRPGFVHRPILEGTQPGATLEFSFNGTAVGLAVLAGPDAGNISYRIDNGPQKQMSLFTRWSHNLYLPWYELLGDELTDGQHKLWLQIAESKAARSEGHAIRIVYFLVNGRQKSRPN